MGYISSPAKAGASARERRAPVTRPSLVPLTRNLSLPTTCRVRESEEPSIKAKVSRFFCHSRHAGKTLKLSHRPLAPAPQLRYHPPMQTYALIVAMDQNRLIGANNDLPWNLPADLARFKAVTMDGALIMGRKTYESIGRPLPGRETIVISRTPSESPLPHVTYVTSLDEALAVAKTFDKKTFVIGGEEIFRLAMEGAERMFVTHIDGRFEGDRYFPEFSETEWDEVSSEERTADERNSHGYRFAEYRRK